MEDIKQKVLNEMRKPELFIKKVVDYVEKNVDDAFGIACRKNLSLNEWQPDSSFGDQLNQKTVLLTVRMFDLWETAIVDVLNEHLHKKFKVNVKPSHDSIGDLEIIFPDGKKEKWEVKTTQGKDSFTGATHSASKCDNYILISYNINKEMKLKENSDNKGFVTEIAVFVWDNMKMAKWQGKPSENSSWTTLKFPSEIINVKPEIVVVGTLEPKAKWCKIVRQKLVN